MKLKEEWRHGAKNKGEPLGSPSFLFEPWRGARVGSHRCPMGHEFAIRFRRNHPVLDLAFRHTVFLSVFRTVSMLIASTTSNATNSSANSCRVHLP